MANEAKNYETRKRLIFDLKIGYDKCFWLCLMLAQRDNV